MKQLKNIAIMPKNIARAAVFSVFLFAPFSIFHFPFSISAHAFTGPGGAAGSGVGAIGVDASGNLSVGTPTPLAGTKLLIVGADALSTSYALRVHNNAGTPILVIRDDGRVGVRNALPASELDVAGDIRASGSLIGNYAGTISASNVMGGVFSSCATCGSSNFAFPLSLGINTPTQVGLPQELSVYGDAYVRDNVGVGTEIPLNRLHVEGTSGALFSVRGTSLADSRAEFYRAGTRIGLVNWDAGEFRWQADGGATPAAMTFYTGGLERVRIISTGNVGIGTASPGYRLDIVSGGATTARFGTASTDGVVIGGGQGKLTVGTIDPIYTIGGKKYATYVSGMTGVKEETTGIAYATCDKGQATCKKVIDFNKTEEGSDLWLFAKTTNLKENFAKLAVLLTPSFDGRVWYEKDGKNLTLKIFALPAAGSQLPDATYEVSYRFTAPRFDYQNWPNTSDDSATGFVIPD